MPNANGATLLDLLVHGYSILDDLVFMEILKMIEPLSRCWQTEIGSLVF